MTLEDLLRDIKVEGAVKVQSWENENSPTIYYEDQMMGGCPAELEELYTREVDYIFPYTFYHGKALIAGICIELVAEEETEE